MSTQTAKRETQAANGVAGEGATVQAPAPVASPWEKLRAPFPADRVGLLPKPTKKDNTKGTCDVCGKWHGLPAVHLDYVGHADVTDRLLSVDPEWNWEPCAYSSETGMPVMVSRNNSPVGLWIRLTVCGVTRLGYGSVEPGAFDPEKQLIGDALRNAAMRFGVGLDLWKKDEAHTVDAPSAGSKPKAAAGSPPTVAKGKSPTRVKVGRGCPRDTCDGDLERVTWPDGNENISCSNWRDADGRCRYREDVTPAAANPNDQTPIPFDGTPAASPTITGLWAALLGLPELTRASLLKGAGYVGGNQKPEAWLAMLTDAKRAEMAIAVNDIGKAQAAS